MSVKTQEVECISYRKVKIYFFMIADLVGLESYQLRKELIFFLYDSTGKTWEHWGKVIENLFLV